MSINTKDDNLFRYIHFKPARLSEKLKAEVEKEIERRKEVKSKKRPEPDPARLERKNQILALKNLEALDLTTDVNLNDPNSLLTLNKRGQDKLSNLTKKTLKLNGLDPIKMSHLQLVNRLNAVLVNTEVNSPSFQPSPQLPNETQGYVQDVGTANLLVVKQQIIRYEAAEIAHIENVIAGEKKIRTHAQLTRSEELFSTVTDKTTDTETELETTERFELNKETSKTFQKDTELGLELTLSGKYGPTISFESNFNAGQTTSLTETDEQSVSFAKDTVERSKERIVEKITVKQERTLIREIKEKNKHILKNTDQKHKFAIYQYVDKIYESQVFDYGKRQMFDFMVPEPSSYLWYLKSKAAYELGIQAPKPLQDKLGNLIEEPKDITKFNYQELGALYGVNDLSAPPDIYVTKRFRMLHGDGAASDSEKHKTGISDQLEIPKGYQPNLAHIEILATSDETLAFSINIGGNIVHYKKADFEETDVSGGHEKYHLKKNKVIALGHDVDLKSDQKLHIDIYGYESANYAFHFEITFYALYDSSVLEYDIISEWKQKMYAKLAEAYQTALLQYEQEKSFLIAEAEAEGRNEVDFGNPPAENKKIIHNELKKHCLAIIRNEHLGTLTTLHAGQPPQFNLSDAKEDGEMIRFLEHAFEWSQIQYVFYPYFWARPDFDQKGWTDRFFEKNNDYTMKEFLKSGYARVVVPVREGFDKAVSYFIETGKPFYGLGEPDLHSPLYISITDEIKERTGADKDEIPVGEPWETRLPTAAIIVKDLDVLPEWEKIQGENWKWKPKEL